MQVSASKWRDEENKGSKESKRASRGSESRESREASLREKLELARVSH